MTEDSEREQARAAEEAIRAAEEEAVRTKTRVERLEDEARSGPMAKELLGQQGVIYGALIIIGTYMVTPFLTAPSLDASATTSIVAFAVAIPFLAALVLVNRQEAFRGRRTPSVTVTIAQGIGQGAALVGIVAGFWHMTWIAGVTFLVAAFVAMGIHSAGFWRLESARGPAS